MPALEDVLAHAGRELERAAQRQHVRLGHHVLALLIALDRVGVRGALLEQHVRHAELGGPRGRAHAARAGTDDRDLDPLAHGPWNTTTPFTSLRP